MYGVFTISCRSHDFLSEREFGWGHFETFTSNGVCSFLRPYTHDLFTIALNKMCVLLFCFPPILILPQVVISNSSLLAHPTYRLTPKTTKLTVELTLSRPLLSLTLG